MMDIRQKAIILLGRRKFPYLEFRCSNCYFSPSDLQWLCPQCKKWDAMDFLNSRIVDSYSQFIPRGKPAEASKD
jgi:hypothetical protein